MFTKSLIAAVAIATVAAVASAPAQAKPKVDIDVYLGLGDGYEPGYYYEPEPRYHRPAPRRYEEPRRYVEPRGDYGSACEEGINEVRAAGFQRVRPLDCSGRTFTYKARKRGNSYVVTVKRKSGNIIGIEQVW